MSEDARGSERADAGARGAGVAVESRRPSTALVRDRGDLMREDETWWLVYTLS